MNLWTSEPVSLNEFIISDGKENSEIRFICIFDEQHAVRAGRHPALANLFDKIGIFVLDNAFAVIDDEEVVARTAQFHEGYFLSHIGSPFLNIELLYHICDLFHNGSI